MRKIFPTLALALATSACSSIIDGTSQPLTVKSEKGADCAIKSSNASYVATAPATITVKRSVKDFDVTCKKDGFETANTKLESGLDPWFLGNILFGGLIGITVDAATGAMGQYPDEVNVDLKKSEDKSRPST